MKKFKPISENPPISNLKADIFTEIFSLLPIKSILACKLVCKLWCSIIRNPHFSMSSKSIALFVRSIEHYKNLHLVEPLVDYETNNGDLSLVHGENSVIKFNNSGFGSYPFAMFDVVNCCKGLVCFVSGSLLGGINKMYSVFVVCNPVTSDYVVIERPISVKRACHCEQKQIGFGFSAKSDQYKLISFFNDVNKSNDEGQLMAEVCILGSDEKWREVDNRPPQGYIWCGNGVFLEGSVNWIVLHCMTSVGRIASFDCQEEKSVLVDLPTDSVYDDFMTFRPLMELSILQSRLCFCIWTVRVRQNCDIWVMDEYGVKESWRKLFIVSSGESPASLTPYKPLAYMYNGEILMLSVLNELVSYNVGSNTWRVVKVFGVDAMVDALPLDPSFVPTKNLLMHGVLPKTTETA